VRGEARQRRGATSFAVAQLESAELESCGERRGNDAAEPSFAVMQLESAELESCGERRGNDAAEPSFAVMQLESAELGAVRREARE
jgi:hypothetical protein